MLVPQGMMLSGVVGPLESGPELWKWLPAWGLRALALSPFGFSLLLPNPLESEERSMPQAPAPEEVGATAMRFCSDGLRQNKPFFP